MEGDFVLPYPVLPWFRFNPRPRMEGDMIR